MFCGFCEYFFFFFFCFGFFLFLSCCCCCGISEEEEEALWSLELLLKVGWLDFVWFLVGNCYVWVGADACS